MQDLKDRVAVITGAGSGFGRAFATRCAGLGMRLMIADRNRGSLETAAGELRTKGARVRAVPADVSSHEQVEALAAATYSEYGAAHLVFNNAGVVLPPLPAWEHTVADWEYLLGPNLWGVIHGVNAFVPRMIASGEPGHIVNTASVAGLLTVEWLAGYCVSKHAVVALSECLFRDLRERKHPIGVSVLCPAWVNTGLVASAAARTHDDMPEDLRRAYEDIHHALESGRLKADDVARITLDAVMQSRFYVLPHRRIADAVRLRMEDILELRDPSPVPQRAQPKPSA